MENEIWKEIPGYEGLYEVSNYGQIRSIERLANYKVPIYAKALQPDKVFALWVRLDYTGKLC